MPPLLIVGTPLLVERRTVSEAAIGPFELQDFFLYYVSRFGHRPSRVVFLAEHAWGDRQRDVRPDDVPPEKRSEYNRGAIKRRLTVCLQRFSETSQFKTIGAAERAQGGFWWFVVAAQWLARPER